MKGRGKLEFDSLLKGLCEAWRGSALFRVCICSLPRSKSGSAGLSRRPAVARTHTQGEWLCNSYFRPALFHSSAFT